MSDKQRRDYGSGSISQRKDGTWTARIIIGANEAGKPRIKAFYGKSEREVKKKLKEFEKELHKNDGVVVQKNTVEAYMLNWLYSVKSNELKKGSCRNRSCSSYVPSAAFCGTAGSPLPGQGYAVVLSSCNMKPPKEKVLNFSCIVLFSSCK